MSANAPVGEVSEFMHRGEWIRFLVANPNDVIQSRHRAGEFYELQELAIIERHMPRGGVYVDVGANVGNHLVYVGKYCAPRELYGVEPNITALRLLQANLDLNQVRVSVLAAGLSDAPGRAEAFWPEHNLGGAKLHARDNGRVRLMVGDEIFKDRQIDFLKVDVEGSEIAVLTGLKASIRANRPAIFVEVDDGNRALMADWIAAAGYRVEDRFRRYATNENLLLLPL